MFILITVITFITPQGIEATSQSSPMATRELCESAARVLSNVYNQNRKTFSNTTYIRADSACIRSESKY